jgi:hypothetical protein
MIRFACPRCKSILEQPENVAGTNFACPSCGQRLQVPMIPESKARPGDPAGNDLPAPASAAAAPPPIPLSPPPFVTASQRPVPASAAPSPPPAPARSPPRYRDCDDDYDDDDFPSIERHGSRRGKYSQEMSAKAAASGLVCSVLSLGLLLVTFVLWILIVQGQQRGRMGGDGEPLIAVILLLILGSFVLALLGIVFSSRGLDEGNRYNRGQATAGLVCGIVSLVIGSVVGLFFLCMGMVFWSIPGRW